MHSENNPTNTENCMSWLQWWCSSVSCY